MVSITSVGGNETSGSLGWEYEWRCFRGVILGFEGLGLDIGVLDWGEGVNFLNVEVDMIREAAASICGFYNIKY